MTLAGGVIVALVAAALSLPLVRGVARDQSREQLVRSVETLAAKPVSAARLLAQQQKALGPDDRLFGIVRRNGEVVGEGASTLTQVQIATLLGSGSLSTSATIDGQEVLIEGRTTKRGFAAVGVQPVGAVDVASKALVRRIIVALLLGLVAAGTLGFVLSRALTRSVAQTAGAARRLAAGERGVDVGSSNVREIADMSRAISSLDEALTSSEGRQREFLLSVSHEIRTPLTALRGYAEALADGAVEPDDIESVGATMANETARLDRFVADLLSLARLEADDFSCESVDVDLADVLRDLESAWQATCRREGIRLDIDPQAVHLKSDAMRLRQLLDGLVENAVRATPSGGGVRVRTALVGADVTLTVSDDGPGLTDKDTTLAFDRGVLREKYLAERQVGTGLGLSISQRLATRMGGEIVAHSSASGGAEFTVILPIG
ncbi:MAG: HAMP domain-containing sensor histidine kinase [Aeromicrobium sp.]